MTGRVCLTHRKSLRIVEEETLWKHARPADGFASHQLSPGYSIYNMLICGFYCKISPSGKLSQGAMSFVRAEVSLCQVAGSRIQNFICLRSYDVGLQGWYEEGRRECP